MHWASPALIACAASITALRPDPHTLLMVSAGTDRGLPRGGLAFATLHDIAENDFIDRAGVDPRPLHGFLHDDRAKLRRAERRKSAQISADWCPRCGNDD